jgi:hypothetical protein
MCNFSGSKRLISFRNLGTCTRQGSNLQPYDPKSHGGNYSDGGEAENLLAGKAAAEQQMAQPKNVEHLSSGQLSKRVRSVFPVLTPSLSLRSPIAIVKFTIRMKKSVRQIFGTQDWANAQPKSASAHAPVTTDPMAG